MKEVKREVRTMCGGQFAPRLREVQGGEGNAESRVIEGYAIVYGIESVIIAEDGELYREIIEPGAVTAEQIAGWDIKMTMFHVREKLLARSKKGVGTLKLTVDEVGVKYEFEAPRTPDGDTALELVKRGDLAGSSFTYWSNEQTSVYYGKTEEDLLLRHVSRVDWCGEMTIASDPAYVETTVNAREIKAAGIVLEDEADKQKPVVDNSEEIEKWRELANRPVY